MRPMSLADAYRTIILDHNRAPRRRGQLQAPTSCVEGINALCGDRLSLELKVEAEYLVEFAFSGEASALTLAGTSMMGDLVAGQPLTVVGDLIEAALDLLTCNPEQRSNPRLGDFNVFIGVLAYPNRIKTVTLPWATLAGALAGRARTSTDNEMRGAVAPAPKRKVP